LTVLSTQFDKLQTPILNYEVYDLDTDLDFSLTSA